MRGLVTDHEVSGPMRGLEKTAPNGANRQTDRHSNRQTDRPTVPSSVSSKFLIKMSHQNVSSNVSSKFLIECLIK